MSRDSRAKKATEKGALYQESMKKRHKNKSPRGRQKKRQRHISSSSPSESASRDASPAITPSSSRQAVGKDGAHTDANNSQVHPSARSQLDKGKDVVEILSSSSSDSSSDSSSNDGELEPENSDAELSRLMEKWTSPIYAFFEPRPEVCYNRGRRYHKFKCSKKNCKVTVNRFLDSKDAKSTGNLRKHARLCWGEETVKTASEAANAEEVRSTIIKSFLRDGSITSAFKRKPGRETYSTRPMTKAQVRAEVVRWVCEHQQNYMPLERSYLILVLSRPSWS